MVSGKRPFMEAREPSLWPFKRYNQRSREEEGQSIIFFGLWLREERHPKAKKKCLRGKQTGRGRKTRQ